MNTKDRLKNLKRLEAVNRRHEQEWREKQGRAVSESQATQGREQGKAPVGTSESRGSDGRVDEERHISE